MKKWVFRFSGEKTGRFPLSKRVYIKTPHVKEKDKKQKDDARTME
jgi:hypothetical protein